MKPLPCKRRCWSIWIRQNIKNFVASVVTPSRPKAVENYHETFARYAREIIDKVASQGRCEFVYEVASELPLMAILDLCGVPKEDRKKILYVDQPDDVHGRCRHVRR